MKFVRVVRALTAAVVVAVALVAALPARALAAGNPPGQPAPQSAPAGTPTLVESMTKPPSGYQMTGDQVLAVAKRNATVIAELKDHPTMVSYVYTRGFQVWQVSWFSQDRKHEMVQLYVDDSTHEVTQVWTGYQVAWTMARGYPGAFGRVITRLYIWIPLCIMFVLPFIPWRRKPTLWHLDLLVMLAFSVSLAFFNQANLGLSVPLVYPCMIYLLVRMVALAFGKGRPREPLRSIIPTRWLAVLLVFLVAFRIGLNVVNSNVIDVGYAGVIGADKLLHGDKLYGNWPADNSQGDTYGPVNYFAYLPFRAIFGWSGSWDSLPAAHAAAIAFDLLTLVGLMMIGYSLRGPTGATVLGYLWAAFPFTTYVMSSNSNDALVACMVVLCLLALRSPPLRGAMSGLAALTKYAPLALAPLMLRGGGAPPWEDLHGPWTPASLWRQRRSLRAVWLFVGAYLLALILPMLRVIVPGNWHAFWEDSIVYQSNRPAPFSVWGLWGGDAQSLQVEQRIWLGLVVLAGLAVMVFPRGRRTLVQVAALAAALMIGMQMSVSYWFYLYIVWFFPLVIVALVLAHPDADSWELAEQEQPVEGFSLPDLSPSVSPTLRTDS